MNKPIFKITIILGFIIILPIAFLIFREVSSLNENERVLEEIYKKQLETILFSVNLYSEDVVRSWSVGLETILENRAAPDPMVVHPIRKLLKENKAISSFFVSDSTYKNNYVVKNGRKDISIERNDKTVAYNLLANDVLIKKLYLYRASNFVKIEPLNSAELNGNRILIFVFDNKRIGGIVIDQSVFVKQNLAPKIQSVEGEEFIIAVFDSLNDKTLYSSDLSIGKFQQSKHLWLFPDYSLGINLKGTTIENLVRERTNMNLILISGMSFLMIVVAWFGYKNIKREVELAQIKSDFVSNVSHELRTPLALISMFAETLSMGRIKNEEKRDEYYKIIQQEIERLSKIVNKILSFSKIESGKWKYNFLQTEINSLAEKIFVTYKFHLQNKGFEFIFEHDEKTIDAFIDPEAVSEAIINLLDNAVKYSNNRKKVILRTGIDGEKLFIEVEDSGVGISHADQKKIFDKFYRVTSGDIHSTKGTGLGLTLVNHIVEAHKGEIAVTSQIGTGSRFRLIFPIDQKK